MLSGKILNIRLPVTKKVQVNSYYKHDMQQTVQVLAGSWKKSITDA